jgi:hypothetical protein
MPGKLFVLGRVRDERKWILLAGGLDQAEATAIVDAALADGLTSRVIVANAIRSFHATVASAEDAVATVDP